MEGLICCNREVDIEMFKNTIEIANEIRIV